MTSSEPKMRLWIFCPQMTLHDIPRMSQIGVKLKNTEVGKNFEITTVSVNEKTTFDKISK